ncbi:urease accessory protein UreD [Modestobacter lapidis]|nr:urease accessory protein UreD [Modestobacter lapidis]
MRARATLATALAADGRTRVATLHSQAPLTLRLTHPKGPEPWTGHDAGAARVCVAASAAGPIGGDDYDLTVDVGAGSTLVLRDISATLLLPGPHGELSRLRTTVQVGAGATLVWLPEPVIAAHGCRHRSDIRVELGTGARLILSEQLLLGRHGEQPGSVVQHLRVRLAGRPLLNQQLAVGPGAAGWDGSAVIGDRRAIGSLVVVDPGWTEHPPEPALLGDAAVLPLAGPAVLVSALAPDALTLRRCLDTALARLAGTHGHRQPAAR